MGILNVTPDSFSDGGEFQNNAIDRAVEMINEGADIIDIGGQSTRPDAKLISLEEEMDRVIPVVSKLSKVIRELNKNRYQKVLISVDTYRYQIAQKAIESGVDIINDVTGGNDNEMLKVIAKNPEVKYIIMHSRGIGNKMVNENYQNVYQEVLEELKAKVNKALDFGVKKHQIIVDPGPGFSKPLSENNWPLIENINQLKKDLGYDVLLAVSRKRFLRGEKEKSIKDRDFQTAYISSIAYEQNAWGVRVHNVLATYDVLKAFQMHNEQKCFKRYNKSNDKKKYATISVKGIEAYGKHGVNQAEKDNKQKFKVDVDYKVDISKSVISDNIDDTVSYSQVAKTVVKVIEGEHCDLIEKLVAQIDENIRCLDERICDLKIVLHKPDAPVKVPFEDIQISFCQT